MSTGKYTLRVVYEGNRRDWHFDTLEGAITSGATQLEYVDRLTVIGVFDDTGAEVASRDDVEERNWELYPA